MSKGFSLIELLIVIGLISVLAIFFLNVGITWANYKHEQLCRERRIAIEISKINHRISTRGAFPSDLIPSNSLIRYFPGQFSFTCPLDNSIYLNTYSYWNKVYCPVHSGF